MKNRYYFLKRLYPNFIIVFNKKGKMKSLGIDNLLIPYLKLSEISYIEVDSYNKIKVHRMFPNKYKKYVMYVSFKRMINYIDKKLIIK